MLHTKSTTVMAVKVRNSTMVSRSFVTTILAVLQRIRSTVEEKEQKQLLMDLEVVMRSNNCPFIVQFYGALFTEVLTAGVNS